MPASLTIQELDCLIAGANSESMVSRLELLGRWSRERGRCLLPVDASTRLEIEPVALTTTLTPEGWVYVAIGADGRMAVGRMEPGRAHPPAQTVNLRDYRREQDEIVGLWLMPRRLSDVAQVWVLGWRWPADAARRKELVWRGQVAWRAGCDGPELFPESDDPLPSVAVEWPQISPPRARWPAWFARASLRTPLGYDHLSSERFHGCAIRALEAAGRDVQRGIWTGRAWVFTSPSRGVILCDSAGSRVHTHAVPHAPTALLPWVGRAPQGGPDRIVVTLSDGTVTGYELDDETLTFEQAWTDLAPGIPVALAWAAEPGPEGWGDLLMACSDGRLHTLRPLARELISRPLDALLGGLADDPAILDILEAGGGAMDRLDIRPTEELAQGLLEVIAHRALREGAPRPLLDRAADLFQLPAFVPYAGALGQRMGRLVQDASPAALPSLLALCEAIYDRAHFAFQMPIDRALEPLRHRHGAALGQLGTWAQRNRWDVLREAEPGAPTHDRVVADFAQYRHFLHERSLHVAPTVARVLPLDGRALGLVGTHGVYAIDVDAPDLTPRWRPARGLITGAACVSLVGGLLLVSDTGSSVLAVRLRDGATLAERDGPPHATFRGAVALNDTDLLALMWTIGRRTVIERVRFDEADVAAPLTRMLRAPPLAHLEEEVTPLVTPAASSLVAGEAGPDGGRLLAIGGEASARVELVHVGVHGVSPVAMVQVDSGVTALALAGGARPRLLTGTRGGLVWCHPLDGGLAPIWTFRVKGAIRGLHTQTLGDGVWRVAACSEEEEVVLLDHRGVRVGRTRPNLSGVRARVRGGVFLTGSHARLAVACEDGALLVFRELDAVEPGTRRTWVELAESAALARASVDPGFATDRTPHVEALRGALAARQGRWLDALLPEGAWALHDSGAQDALVRALGEAGVPLSPDALERVLRALSLRALAGLARALPASDAAGQLLNEIWSAAIDRAPDKEHGPNSPRAHLTALTECVAALRRVGGSLTLLDRWVASHDERETWRDSWLRVELALLWRDSLDRSAGGEGADVAQQLWHLHLLPLPSAVILAQVLPVASEARLLSFLSRIFSFLDEDRPPPPRLLRDIGDGDLNQGVAGLVRRLVCFALPAREAEPEGDADWEALTALLTRAAATPHPQTSPFGRLLAALVGPTRSGPPPETSALAEQARWLRERLGQPLDLGDPRDAPRGWERATRRLARALDARLRAALLRRLSVVAQRVRPRLTCVQCAFLFNDQHHLTLRLSPDGEGRLSDVRISWREVVVDRRRLVRNVQPPAPLTWPTWGAGYDDVVLSLEVKDPHDRGEVQLELEVRSREQGTYTCLWIFPLEGARHATRRAPALLPQLRGAFAALVERLAGLRSGLHLLVADPDLGPEELIAELLKRGSSRAASLDLDAEVFADAPGSPIPRADAVIGAMARQLDWLEIEARGAPRQLLVYPCERTVAACEDPRGAETAVAALSWLRARAARPGPAIVVLLPSVHAAGMRRRLPEVGWINPCATALAPDGDLDPKDGAVMELTSYLCARSHALDTVRGWLEESCGDLRVISALAQRAGGPLTSTPASGLPTGVEPEEERYAPPSPLLEIARADLRALTPRGRVALTLLVACQTSLEVEDLRPEHISVEDLRVEATGASLAAPGHRLGPLEELRRALLPPNPRRCLRVMGYREDREVRFAAWAEPLRAFVPDLGGAAAALVRLGFARQIEGLITAAPLLVRAIEQQRAAQGVASAAGGRRALWELVELAALDRLPPEAAALLCPAEAPSAREVHQPIAALWRAPTAARLARLAPALTGLTATELSGQALPGGLGPGCLAVRLKGRVGTKHAHFLVYAPSAGLASPQARLMTQRDTQDPDTRPFLVALGPGVESAPTADDDQGIVRLDQEALIGVLSSTDQVRAFWATARARGGLELLSPYQLANALPPGSELFVGREVELGRILGRLDRYDALIIGARKLGKTSLLNRVRHELRRRARRYVAWYLELQSVERRDGLEPELEQLMRARGLQLPTSRPDALAMIRSLAAAAHADKRTPVFLLNEIDALARRDPQFFQALRGLSEATPPTRFVMVGYVTLFQLMNDEKGPLHHFKSHPDRVVNLGQLEDSAAERLLDLLEQQPLSLVWRSTAAREQGRRRIIQRAYGVPWRIQELCHELVLHLARERRGELRRDDVDAVLDRSPGLLSYLIETRLDRLLGLPGTDRTHYAGWFTLGVAIDELYYRSGFIEMDPDRTLPAWDYPFTAEQARAWALRRLPTLVVSERDQEAAAGALQALPCELLLQRLTLTLVLSRVPPEVARARPDGHPARPQYCFQNHILPYEIQRTGSRREGTTIDGWIEDWCHNLVRACSARGGRD